MKIPRDELLKALDIAKKANPWKKELECRETKYWHEDGSSFSFEEIVDKTKPQECSFLGAHIDSMNEPGRGIFHVEDGLHIAQMNPDFVQKLIARLIEVEDMLEKLK